MVKLQPILRPREERVDKMSCALTRFPIFSQLAETDRSLIATFLTAETFKHGAVVQRQGMDLTFMYFIISGACCMQHRDTATKQMTSVFRFPGDLIGAETAAQDHLSSAFTSYMLTDCIVSHCLFRVSQKKSGLVYTRRHAQASTFQEPPAGRRESSYQKARKRDE